MKFNWEGIRWALDPRTCCRRYCVSVNGYASGYFRYFWRLKSAQKMFELQKDSAPWVTLQDQFYCNEKGYPIVISAANNQNQFPVPPVFHNEPGKRLDGYCYDARP